MVRPETTEDEAAIRDLTTAAFATAAVASGNEADIVERLRADGDLALSLVAVEEGAVIGHVAFSPVSIGDGDGDGGWYGLGPVSVRPDRQRQGIGSALIREGIERLRALGARGIVLIGDPAYYSRLGFESDGRLTCGAIDTRYVQRLVLVPPAPEGDIRFAPGFGLG